MSRFSRRAPVKVAAVAALTAGALFFAPSAFATDLTAAVTPGAFSATTAVTSALPAVASTHPGGAITGALTLTVDNSTGTLDGWTVSQQVSDFAYEGVHGGSTIDALNFSVAPGTVTGPKATNMLPTAGGALDSAKPVLSADPLKDTIGVHTLALTATLAVPGDSRVGTYKGTLTTTFATAPLV